MRQTLWIGLILVAAMLHQGCAKKTMVLQSDEKIIWVNAYTVRSNDNVCMQIQETQKLTSNWQTLCKNIDGYEHKFGIQSKLLVKDFGNALYRVKSVLEEKNVLNSKFGTDWVLESIPDHLAEVHSSRPPTLVFKENYGIVTGFDGCNNYHGGILELTENRLVFGDFLRTQMACVDGQNIDNEFNWRLSNTYSYAIENGHLIMKDSKGKPILKFKKGEPDTRDRN